MEVNPDIVEQILARVITLDTKVSSLMKNPLDGKERRIATIRTTLEERGKVTVEEIVTELKVSKTYALELMEEAAKEPSYQFVKGSPHKPSYLMKKTAENEADFIANQIRAEFKDKPIGATMTVGHTCNSLGITNPAKLQDIVSRVAKAGSPVQLAPVENPFAKELVQRRFIKVR